MAINSVFDSDDLDYPDDVICKFILYKYIVKEATGGDITSLASSYKDIFVSKVTDMKENYIDYYNMYNHIVYKNINTLYDITDSDETTLYSYYLQKSLNRKFSILYFDPKMYNVSSTTSYEYTYLKKIHENIMIPIMKYYYYTNGTSPKKFHIRNASAYNVPGKQIDFDIDDIELTNIYSDMKKDAFGIKSSIASFSKLDTSIRIKNK